MSGSGYLLWSSLVYVKAGAVAGLVVLAVGGLLLWPLLRPGRRVPDDSTHRS